MAMAKYDSNLNPGSIKQEMKRHEDGLSFHGETTVRATDTLVGASLYIEAKTARAVTFAERLAKVGSDPNSPAYAAHLARQQAFLLAMNRLHEAAITKIVEDIEAMPALELMGRSGGVGDGFIDWLTRDRR